MEKELFKDWQKKCRSLIPNDERIFNRPREDGSYRPLSEFFEKRLVEKEEEMNQERIKSEPEPKSKYYVLNRITKEEALVEASSAQEACEKMGWMIGNCFVRKNEN